MREAKRFEVVKIAPKLEETNRMGIALRAVIKKKYLKMLAHKTLNQKELINMQKDEDVKCMDEISFASAETPRYYKKDPCYYTLKPCRQDYDRRENLKRIYKDNRPY